MDTSDFVARYPRLFHMAAVGSWPSIARLGLLSTRALVDVYDPPPRERDEILNGVRRRSFRLEAQGLPGATIRDQLPLKFLSQCLSPGVSEQDYLDELNSRVFFHVRPERLMRLLGARAYRRQPQEILTFDTRRFLGAHKEVELAPYNSGSVHLPTMPARGPEMFTAIEEYDWEHWRRKRTPEHAVVELTVPTRASLDDSLLSVSLWQDSVATTDIWRR